MAANEALLRIENEMEKLSRYLTAVQRNLSVEKSKRRRELLNLKNTLRAHEAALRSAISVLEEDLSETLSLIAELDDDANETSVAVEDGLKRSGEADAFVSKPHCSESNGENENTKSTHTALGADLSSKMHQ